MLGMSSTVRSFLETATEREIAVRLEIYTRSTGEFVQAIDSREDSDAQLVSGQVTVDASQEILRTATLQIIDPGGQLTVGVDGLIGLDKRYVLRRGYYIPALRDWHLWPLGEFELTAEPQVDASTGVAVIHLTLGDKASGANGRPRGGLHRALRVSQGTGKRAAIQAIAGVETWGETRFNLWGGSTATVPYDLAWEPNRHPWEAAQQVAAIPEPDGTITRLYYAPDGPLTLAPDPGPDIDVLPAVWSAAVSQTALSQLISARRVVDLFAIGNAVTVRWGSALVTPGEYTAIDQNLNSPTAVQNIGWFLRAWKGGQQDELIRNLAEGQARAEYELRRLLAFQEKVPFAILEHPALEPWDVVEITDPAAGVVGKYQLLKWSISLDTTLTMNCEGWRVRKLA